MGTSKSDRAILHLGSGLKYMPGAVNVDVTPAGKPDVVHDLNVRPWPFETSSFHDVYAYDVIEHLEDVMKTVEEIHRVCRPGGILNVIVPHFSSDEAFTDPTHRHYFGSRTFDYMVDGHSNSFYTHVRFRVLTRQIVFRSTITNKLVHRLANRFPTAYEERWTWIFPAWFLFFRLEAVKPA